MKIIIIAFQEQDKCKVCKYYEVTKTKACGTFPDVA